jgi:DNA invertase Pin-like site-specific DNA recombinase
MTATLGYAQVSTTGQDLDAQLNVLTADGVDAVRIFTDKLSGAVSTDRLGLAALLHYAREGTLWWSQQSIGWDDPLRK